MRLRAAKRLRDVVGASEEILTFTKDKSFEDYAGDRGLRLMVERLFAIVGEAMSRALIEEPDLEEDIPEARQAIGMQNRIAHGYDEVRDDIVWDSVRSDIPALHRRVNNILEERGWT